MPYDPRCSYCADFICVCKRCGKEFNKDMTNMPRVLPCGHSYCFKCLCELKKEQKYHVKCTTCGYETDHIDTCPINYRLLEVRKLLTSCRHFNSGFVCKYHTLVNKVLAKKHYLSSDLQTVGNLLEDFEHYTQDLEMNMENVESDLISKISEEYNELEKIHLNTKHVAAKTFRCFKSSINQIITMLKHGTTRIFYYGFEKFGNVSLADNMILFHTLGERVAEKNSKYIKFEEIMNCFNIKQFGIFLRLCYDPQGSETMVFLKPYETSMLSLFIKLCTGEGNGTYKGCKYNKGNNRSDYNEVVVVQSYEECYENIASNMGVYKMFENEFPLKASDLVVQTTSNGGFKICLVKHITSMLNIIAMVISPENLSDMINYDKEIPDMFKIVDCGLWYKY